MGGKGGESAADLGFRVFKLDSSNIKAWEPIPDDLEQSLLDHVDHIMKGRSEQDILYELLLKRGLDLCAPIEARDIAGRQVNAVDGGALIACLAEEIAPEEVEELALGIAAWRDQLDNTDDTTVVFRDSAFSDDVAKTNCTEILRQRGIESLELRVPGDERWLQPDEAYGSVDNRAVQREMIRKAIREHLSKEKRLHTQGIKVLTLFFIDKERLLSFDEPLKFIFSHSALREGWDNPNVFQICTLRDIRTERERRQTIGRGLRLCVNQDGERQRGFEVNTLTVIAQESYEDFAENLQREIEAETGIRFGVVEDHQFASIAINNAGGQSGHLGMEKSQELWRYLVTAGYIDSQGKIADQLRDALPDGSFTLPDEFEPLRDAITEKLRKAAGRIEVKKAEERRTAQPREAVLNSEEFKALWERIKHKTTYRVRFDNENLLKECAEALHDAPLIPHPRMQWNTADIQVGQSGVQSQVRESSAPVSLRSDGVELPDLVTELQNRTQLTRRSIVNILSDSGRLDDFSVNPQKFIETAAEAINRRKRLALVDQHS